MTYLKRVIAIYIGFGLSALGLSANEMSQTDSFQTIFATCTKNAEMINQAFAGSSWSNTDPSILDNWKTINLDLAKLSPDMAPDQGGRGYFKSWQPVAREKIEEACEKQARDYAEFHNKKVSTAPRKDTGGYRSSKSKFNIYERRTFLTLPLSDAEKNRLDDRDGVFNSMVLAVVFDDVIICEDELSGSGCTEPSSEILDEYAVRALEGKSCNARYLSAPEGPVFGGRYFDKFQRGTQTFEITNRFTKNGGRGYIVSPFGIPLLRLWNVDEDNWTLIGRYTLNSFTMFGYQDRVARSILELVENSTDSFEQTIDWEKITTEILTLGASPFSGQDLPARDLISEMKEPTCVEALKLERERATG